MEAQRDPGNLQLKVARIQKKKEKGGDQSAKESREIGNNVKIEKNTTHEKPWAIQERKETA